MNEYITYGGFPAIVNTPEADKKKERLNNLITTYLEKDIAFFFGIRHPDKLRDFLKYLSANNGGLFNHSNATQNLRMAYNTVEDYLNILHQTYILIPLAPFSKSLTTELKKSKKIYFLDTGLRNFITGNFLPLENRSDAGQLLENFILRELLDKYPEAKINYWRTTAKAEVDFTLSTSNETIPIEVKTNNAKISASMLNFIENYKPKKAVIFNQGKFGVETIKNTKIFFIPHYFI